MNKEDFNKNIRINKWMWKEDVMKVQVAKDAKNVKIIIMHLFWFLDHGLLFRFLKKKNKAMWAPGSAFTESRLNHTDSEIKAVPASETMSHCAMS